MPDRKVPEIKEYVFLHEYISVKCREAFHCVGHELILKPTRAISWVETRSGIRNASHISFRRQTVIRITMGISHNTGEEA